MQIFAHRGASLEAPENSFAAFELALELGVAGIELDVRLAADGLPVILHDERLDRTTSGSGFVSEHTSDQVRALDAGDRRGVPSLGEVVELISGRVCLDVELKAPGTESATLNALAPLGHDRWVISSFDWDLLRNIRRMSPAAVLWPLSAALTKEALDVAEELGAPLLALHHLAIDANSAAVLRSRNLGFMAWTVNDPDRAHALDALGADVVCTDNPRTLLPAQPTG